MPVTQKDIARVVGVSQTIVSDVLQNRPRARVGAETRRRIAEAAQEMGYRPNASARSLRTRRSLQVAYVLSRSGVSHGYSLGERALASLATALSEQDYQLNLRVIPDADSAPERLKDLFQAGQCDACVIRALEAHRWDWETLQDLALPILVLGHVPKKRLSSIAFDTDAAVTTICTYLQASGRTRCLTLTSAERVDYYALLQASWQKISPDYGIVSQERRAEDRQEAADLTRVCFNTADAAPNAFVCFQNRAAVGVTDVLTERGSRPGDDVEVIVCGQPVFGEETSDWLFPAGVMLVDNNQEEIGRLSAGEVLRLIGGGAPAGPIRIASHVREAAKNKQEP